MTELDKIYSEINDNIKKHIEDLVGGYKKRYAVLLGIKNEDGTNGPYFDEWKNFQIKNYLISEIVKLKF